MKRVISLGSRWHANYLENGIFTLLDLCIECAEKNLERELMLEEKYACLKAKLNLLKAENELLKN